MLVDGCAVPSGSINLRNRGIMGTGHGWASGWSVLRNNRAANFIVQNPPGAINGSTGDVGEHKSEPMLLLDQPAGGPLPVGVIKLPGILTQWPGLGHCNYSSDK